MVGVEPTLPKNFTERFYLYRLTREVERVTFGLALMIRTSHVLVTAKCPHREGPVGIVLSLLTTVRRRNA